MPAPIQVKPARPCPVCGKPALEEFAPFCSARCQDIDLNRWLSGVYRIPSEEEPQAGSEDLDPDGD